MKKPTVINPWEIAFAVVYPGRYALFENRELVHKTLQNLAQLQDIQCISPSVPAIYAGSAGKAVQAGEELWIEEHYLRSGEHPPMPRYMFARLVASIFQHLNNSMKNKELLKMLALEKSLVYFTTSLKSNEVVMEKTLKGKVIKLYEEDEDILEDAIIENKQAMEMAKIYSDILSGTMDTYASIISNNLNIVMKVLTTITIILSIPTIIGSYWGMNVPVPFSNNQYGFYIVIGVSLLIAIINLFDV